jgi:hypothetical protein
MAVVQVQALGAAALGNIVKSLARAQYQDEKLFRSLSAAVLRLPSSSFDAQVNPLNRIPETRNPRPETALRLPS